MMILMINSFINSVVLIQVDEAASQKEAVEQQLHDVLNAQVKSTNQDI